MPPTSPKRRGFLTVLVIVILVATGAALWSSEDTSATPEPQKRDALIDVLDGPRQQERTQLDVSLYSPAETPAPAIVLTHGFGEDKNTVAGQAMELARRGFTVVTYSSRGCGHSGGRIALNAADYEVSDARQVIDWLARQSEVRRNADRDPVVGVTGASYGGALSILLAGSDPRVDAIVPVATYNDLNQAILPNTATTGTIPATTPARESAGPNGVFKRSWAGLVFSSAAGGTTPKYEAPERPLSRHHGPDREPADPPSTVESEQPIDPPQPPRPPRATPCGNFAPGVCAAYSEIAQSGRTSKSTTTLLDRLSPKRVTSDVKVPTLLVQGERDTLFGLDQADANARQIAADGTKVKMIWYAGGHDGGAPGPQLRNRVADWFAFHLGGVPPVADPGTGFEFDVTSSPRRNGHIPVRTVAAPGYPGVTAPRTPRYPVALHGSGAQVINPPGASPSSTSTLPGTGAAQDAARRLGQSLANDVPAQTATFSSDPTQEQLLITGSAQVRLSVASVPGRLNNTSAVLFAKLYDVAPDGNRLLAGNAVSPMHISDLAADGKPTEVDVSLPGVVHTVPRGHHLELAVTTTDQSYATPTRPAAYRIGLAGDDALSVPSVKGVTATVTSAPVAGLLGIGGVALVLLIGWCFALINRRRPRDFDAALADTPLGISGLSKRYPDDVMAVNALSMTVRRGEIVGLLGPNGAGKTTTLRMVLGLAHPSEGQVRVFGHRVIPGAPVLSRVGSFVERPGFVPHLSGIDNLRSYWAATGRPVLQARFDEALQIAGLGEEAHRKVSTYSQGAKQRLALAQALLGLPELLILDEPTNGLDPPQIRRLREVLRRYATTGRAVVLSSHLLSEVEHTCTHVVVMHKGELITSGAVNELIASGQEMTFRVDEPERALAALRSVEGMGPVDLDGSLVHADLGAHDPAIAVNALVGAEVAVHQVGPRRRLEDAFLRLVGEEID